MPSLQLLGARALCMGRCGWPDVCSLGGKERQGVSTMSQLCALSILFNIPLLVSRNHFLLCILAGLHSRNLCTQSDWEVPRLLPLLHHSPGGAGPGDRGGFSSWGGQRRAPFFRLAARSMETVFIASAFRWEEQLDPSPRPCLSFSRIQELEAICPPACVCATSAVLPTYRSRLGQACAVLKVIWWQVQFKCSNTAINQATIFISI